MKSIPSTYRRKSTIRKTECVEVFLFTILILAISCSRHSPSSTSPAFVDYESFVSNYSSKTDAATEIYGQYAAEQSNKKVRAKFNLLLDPGERAYIEILDPSDRLMNVLALSQTRISLLWVKDNSYIDEEANPQNLRAIIGLPVNPDDALQLISGQGLQFSSWQKAETLKNGWKLVRGTSSATVVAKEHLSKIETTTQQGTLLTSYEKYELLSDKSLPTRIRFELPERNTNLELRISKYLPRSEQTTPDLFEMKVPADAKKLELKDIYRGTPLLMEN
jgi:hypothetical protein